MWHYPISFFIIIIIMATTIRLRECYKPERNRTSFAGESACPEATARLSIWWAASLAAASALAVAGSCPSNPYRSSGTSWTGRTILWVDVVWHGGKWRTTMVVARSLSLLFQVHRQIHWHSTCHQAGACTLIGWLMDGGVVAVR